MMPLWMFTLGQQITKAGGDIQVPYQGIVSSLLVLTAPSVIGMLIRWRKPQWKQYSDRSIRPMVGFLLFIFCTVRGGMAETGRKTSTGDVRFCSSRRNEVIASDVMRLISRNEVGMGRVFTGCNVTLS